jgi:hypothetical protein
VFTICAWAMFSVIFSILLAIPGFAWMLLLKIASGARTEDVRVAMMISCTFRCSRTLPAVAVVVAGPGVLGVQQRGSYRVTSPVVRARVSTPRS